MRGGSLAVCASISALFAISCSTRPPVLPPFGSGAGSESAPLDSRAANDPGGPTIFPSGNPKDKPVFPGMTRTAGIKGGETPTLPVRGETEGRREPQFDEVLKLQREIVARNPSNDQEQFRLAVLHATGGNFEEAERILSGLKFRSLKLQPYIEFPLKIILGDYKAAGVLLERFNEEERQRTGFFLERAELCSRVKRFRDFVLAESDRVAPGGVVLIYIEPRNFTLKRAQDRYILHLRYDWQLYDDRSTELVVPAWQGAPQEDREDRTQFNGPVSEFFQSFKLPLPNNLAMGQYRVKVTVTDVNTGQSDRVYVPIYVTAR